MIQHIVPVMGRSVAYWERNPEGAQTIVLLHGFRGNHKGLTDLAQHFAGWRVIVPDLPGYGESDPMEVTHTLENYALWLDAFVGVLELKQWVSWSHSYSSSIALIQAVEGTSRPVAMVGVSLAVLRRGPASFASTLYYRLGTFLPYRLQRRWIGSRTVDHATGRWLFMTASTRRRRELQARAEKDLPLLNARVVTEEYFSALDTPLEPYASQVKLPVLIIAGARDVIVPLERLEALTALMSDGTLVVMDDQGHLAPIERPATVASITKRFVNGLGHAS